MAEAQESDDPEIEEDVPSAPTAEEQLQKLAAMQALIFQEIGAPGADVLRERKAQQQFVFDPVVAVLDGLVDKDHCGFLDENLSVIPLADNSDPEIAPADRRQCVEPASEAAIIDHGTHVTGLIVAREYPDAAGPKLRGLNPLARVEAYQLRIASAFRQEVAIETFKKAASHMPKVMNLSFFYPRAPGNDLVARFLKRLENETLVVAAAGNDGNEYTSSCTRLPACLELPNVIAVAALDLSQDAPHPLAEPFAKSDFGPRIHIGAPGLQVPSTIRANRVAVNTGTSQAAPLVSAAASLIFGLVGSVPPSEVRNRLIYTSDLLPSLEGKLLGGRLNIERAIDLETAIVTLKPGTKVWSGGSEYEFPQGVTLRGRITTFGEPPTGKQDFNVRARGAREDLPLDMAWVRRLAWIPAPGDYHLFYEPPGSVDLKRLRVFLESITLPVWMEVVDTGAGVSGPCRFRLSQIADYVSAMKEPS